MNHLDSKKDANFADFLKKLHPQNAENDHGNNTYKDTRKTYTNIKTLNQDEEPSIYTLLASSYLFSENSKHLMGADGSPPGKVPDYTWTSGSGGRRDMVIYEGGKEKIEFEERNRAGDFQNIGNEAGFFNPSLSRFSEKISEIRVRIRDRVNSITSRFRRGGSDASSRGGAGGGGVDGGFHRVGTPEEKRRSAWKIVGAVSLYVGGILSGLAISQADVNNKVNRHASNALNALGKDQTVYTKYQNVVNQLDVLSEENRNLSEASSPLRAELDKTKVELATKNQELEDLKKAKGVDVTTSKTYDQKKMIILSNQQNIDNVLKDLLVAQGMKPKLRHEGLPKKTAEALEKGTLTDKQIERIIKKQEKSLVTIGKKVAQAKKHPELYKKFEKKKRVTKAMSAVSPQKTHIVIKGAVEKEFICDEEFSIIPQGSRYQSEESNQLFAHGAKLAPVSFYNAAPGISKTTLSEQSIKDFVAKTNHLMTGNKEFTDATLSVRKAVTKRGEGLRVYLHRGTDKAYFTLWPNQETRNFSYVKTHEHLLKWAEKKIEKWENA